MNDRNQKQPEGFELPEHEMVPQIISEIVEDEGHIAAIAVVMVMKCGTVRNKFAYVNNTKFSLLAGTHLLQTDLISDIKKFGE